MRGHRHLGASFVRDFSRHWSSPAVPAAPAVQNGPTKTDAAIQAEAAQARLTSQRRTNRRSTVLTTGGEPSAPTTAGSITAPGQASRLGAA